ncbi:MAG: hypothetical protein ACYC3F_13580 [Gemmatimonadaceae bacterium]
MLHRQLRDHHNVMVTIRPASRGLQGKARFAVSFGYSHDGKAKRHIVRGAWRTRSGTLLTAGGATILSRNH